MKKRERYTCTVYKDDHMEVVDLDNIQFCIETVDRYADVQISKEDELSLLNFIAKRNGYEVTKKKLTWPELEVGARFRWPKAKMNEKQVVEIAGRKGWVFVKEVSSHRVQVMFDYKDETVEVVE